MRIETAIARELSASNVGLFRKQLFDRLPDDMHGGNIEKISTTLNAMKQNGHVEKSPRVGLDGSRWSITPQGRAAYSVMHDDVEPDKDQSVDSTQGDDMTQEQIDLKLANLREELRIEAEDYSDQIGSEFLTFSSDDPFRCIDFDLADDLDRGLFGIVELIRRVAAQPSVSMAIENKTECVTELEKLENAEFLSNRTRAILTRVRLAVEEMEELS